jgi:hypothetical protein
MLSILIGFSGSPPRVTACSRVMAVGRRRLGCLEPQRLTSYRNRGVKTRGCLSPDYAKHVVGGVRPEAAISASLFAVILFGVPFCRPPRPSPRFEPDIAYSVATLASSGGPGLCGIIIPHRPARCCSGTLLHAWDDDCRLRQYRYSEKAVLHVLIGPTDFSSGNRPGS